MNPPGGKAIFRPPSENVRPWSVGKTVPIRLNGNSGNFFGHARSSAATFSEGTEKSNSKSSPSFHACSRGESVRRAASERGILSASIAHPTPEASSSRGKSAPSPSERSIIAEANLRARRKFPSSSRGWNVYWCVFPSVQDAPSAPVTNSASPARAPDRKTAVPRGTVPSAVTWISNSGPSDKSPPTMDSPNSRAAFSSAPYSARTESAGNAAGATTSVKIHAASPPIAAMSEIALATAFRATKFNGVLSKKWWLRITGSVVASKSCREPAILNTAQSSPGPVATSGRWTKRGNSDFNKAISPTEERGEEEEL